MNLRAKGLWLFGLLILFLVIVGPFVVIWALNTLFQLGLGYTFWNWLAVVVLSAWIQTRIGKTNS